VGLPLGLWSWLVSPVQLGRCSGPGIGQMFNLPGLPPSGDPRTPDIIVTPNIGVT
jgi:hypothetical protein